MLEAPPAYDTAEGERILKERLDELRRGTLDALRAAEAKNERLAAENAAAKTELADCRRKLAMDHVEAESKLAAELDRLTAETVDAKRQLNDCRRKLAIEKRRAENAPRRERAAAAVALRAQKAWLRSTPSATTSAARSVKSARRRRERFRRVAPRQPAAAPRDGRDLRGAPAAVPGKASRRPPSI